MENKLPEEVAGLKMEPLYHLIRTLTAGPYLHICFLELPRLLGQGKMGIFLSPPFVSSEVHLFSFTASTRVLGFGLL